MVAEDDWDGSYELFIRQVEQQTVGGGDKQLLKKLLVVVTNDR